MPHKQRGHQCFCGSTPLLRASSYIARLFLSGRTKKKKNYFLKTLRLSKIFVISGRVCFLFPILTAPVKAEKWGGEWIYMKVSLALHSPSFIALYCPPSATLFGFFSVLFLVFSAFLLGVFTKEGNRMNTGVDTYFMWLVENIRSWITFKIADSLSAWRDKALVLTWERGKRLWLVQSCTYGWIQEKMRFENVWLLHSLTVQCVHVPAQGSCKPMTQFNVQSHLGSLMAS